MSSEQSFTPKSSLDADHIERLIENPVVDEPEPEPKQGDRDVCIEITKFLATIFVVICGAPIFFFFHYVLSKILWVYTRRHLEGAEEPVCWIFWVLVSLGYIGFTIFATGKGIEAKKEPYMSFWINYWACYMGFELAELALMLVWWLVSTIFTALVTFTGIDTLHWKVGDLNNATSISSSGMSNNATST